MSNGLSKMQYLLVFLNHYFKINPYIIMKISKILSLLTLITVLSLPFTSCIKEGINAIDGKGENYIRIPQASDEVTILPIAAEAGTKEAILISVVRDANSEASLNSAVTVKLKTNLDLIKAYNSAHPTDSLTELPSNLYQAVLDVNMASGVFAQDIVLKIDPSKLNLSKKYAIGVSVAEAGSYKVREESKAGALVKLVFKNQWHGKYRATGIFHHPTAGDRNIDRDKDVTTVDGNSVETELGDLGGAGYSMILKINSDNTVTISPKGATPAPLNQSYGPNVWDPVKKEFRLHYSYNVSAPRIIEETIKLK